ncbi:DUF1592 domain-containing protein [Stieleria varia]
MPFESFSQRCPRVILVLMLLLGSWASTATADSVSFRQTVQPFFAEHCVRCHDEKLTEGELNLRSLSADFDDSMAAQRWVEILDRINLGEMPPEDEPRPTPEQLEVVTGWITDQLQQMRAAADSTGGRVVLRRLTRLEYANTVRDLLGVEFVQGKGPLDVLPPDGSIRGFDRNSRALLVDPSLLDAYLQVAETVAEKAIQFRPPLITSRTMRFEFRDTKGSAMEYLIDQRSAEIVDGRMVLMEGNARTFGKLRHPFSGSEIPATAEYRVRVQASAVPGADGDPVYMDVRQGPAESFAQFRVDASPDSPQVYEAITTRDELFQGEFQIGIVNGSKFHDYVGSRGEALKESKKAFDQGRLVDATRIKARLRAQGDYDTNNRGAFSPNAWKLDDLPKLYLDWIEVTGPLGSDYPPQSMRQVFSDGWDPETLDADGRWRVIRRLLPRAYRRKVSNTEIQQITDLIQSELDAGHDLQRAMRTGVVAILCSPSFLYLYEASETDNARLLQPMELASRLSYFLWSSKPDDELFALAVQGKLSDPKVLESEVNRMLGDDRIDGFLQGFARQWLKIDQFNQFPADEKIFPQFYETRFVGLESDVAEQPLAMIGELIRSDEPVTALLDSDWTMLNERLASFYDIDGVSGDRFQRVALTSSQSAERSTTMPSPEIIRGGLLGMAGVHRWGSDGSRTKPVERGKYILDVLFNDPPPPPPPNAGEVEPNLGGKKLTVRERLRLHREQTTCNNCHRRIDPYGLALENFNVIGQWRDRFDGEKPLNQWGDDRPEIDASGQLPSGESFDDFVQFKQALQKQRSRFVRGLTEKMLMYALARTLVANDRPTIDQIISEAGGDEMSFRSLIQGIAASKAFRAK